MSAQIVRTAALHRPLTLASLMNECSIYRGHFGRISNDLLLLKWVLSKDRVCLQQHSAFQMSQAPPCIEKQKSERSQYHALT